MYEHLITLQKRLAKRVKIEPFLEEPKIVAGVDVAFSKKDNLAFCSIVVMDSDFNVLEVINEKSQIFLPYIPGLLSFRELPVILKAYKKLSVKPDIFIMDSQGIAHPRFLGLASHFGVVFGEVAVGCAKSKLVGDYGSVGDCKGDYSYLKFKSRCVGAVVRTKSGVKPVFVSPGHRIDVVGAVKIVLKFTTKYRLPEPTRLAHINADKYKKQVVG